MHSSNKVTILFFGLVFLAGPGLPTDSSPTASDSEQIALHEAEILIYLLPAAKQIRYEGMDIGWELQTAPRINQYTREDYYTFWVVNAKRTGTFSVTVGYYSVNKHTADVWSHTTNEIVTSAEIQGVQKILHRAHRIDEHTIKQYRSAGIHIGSGSAPHLPTAVPKPEPIAVHEAEILLYLLPAAKEMRREGIEIEWKLQTDLKSNQKDYYVFWDQIDVPDGTGSDVAGYYAVNKHTGDVWDLISDRIALTTEIEGVQRILRRAHGIDENTIEKYRSRSIDAPEPPQR